MGQVFIRGDESGDVTAGSGVDATGQVNSFQVTGTFPFTANVDATWTIADPPQYGTVTLSPSPADTITWTYTLDDSNPAVQDLALNETLGDVFVLQATPTSGGLGPGSQAIDITIFGVCFANGTLIETECGPLPVEKLQPGLKVWTKDAGLQPIIWLGGGPCPEAEWRADASLRPVRIAAGALGPNCPRRDLYVSQNHLIVLRDAQAELFFGEEEVLVAAKHLCALPGIEIVTPTAQLSYHHILCQAHHILDADGCAAESLLLGDETLIALAPDDLRDLDALMQREGTYQGDPARLTRACRRILSAREAALLLGSTAIGPSCAPLIAA